MHDLGEGAVGGCIHAYAPAPCPSGPNLTSIDLLSSMFPWPGDRRKQRNLTDFGKRERERSNQLAADIAAHNASLRPPSTAASGAHEAASALRALSVRGLEPR